MRVSEIYLSVQGEGPRVGAPTVFVRFAGCNLRCAGWPCDTPHAIFPEKFRHEWRTLGLHDVFQEIRIAAEGMPEYNVCFTGGEPFLQNHEELEELVNRLHEMKEVKYIEAFSNGSLAYPTWAADKILFVLDWKLPGSGEGSYTQNRIENVRLLEAYARGHAIKFTIKDRNDFDTAVRIYKEFLEEAQFKVYYGIVWGALDNSTLIDWILVAGLPWMFNMQIHNHVWDRTARGI